MDLELKLLERGVIIKNARVFPKCMHCGYSYVDESYVKCLICGQTLRRRPRRRRREPEDEKYLSSSQVKKVLV